MKFASLQDLLIDQLRDLYSAESQIIKALPKMAEHASAPELKAAFQTHLEQTRRHAERLERIGQLLNTKVSGETCEAMEGLIEEGEDLMGEKGDAAVMDAGLIAAAQKVEHYEMAGYGSVRTWAQQLGNHQVAELLQQTLQEEKDTDFKLNQLAERTINTQAAHAQAGSR